MKLILLRLKDGILLSEINELLLELTKNNKIKKTFYHDASLYSKLYKDKKEPDTISEIDLLKILRKSYYEQDKGKHIEYQKEYQRVHKNWNKTDIKRNRNKIFDRKQYYLDNKEKIKKRSLDRYYKNKSVKELGESNETNINTF
jgi:hypothetical protein